MTYQIIVKDLSGNAIGEIDRFKNLTYKRVLNREGDFSFDMSMLDQKANSTYIAHRQREVYIYRDGQVVFGGDMFLDSGTAKFTNDDIFTVSGKGFLNRLINRYSDPGFDSTGDAGSEFQTLFNTTNALSSTGITVGTVQTSVSREVQADRKQLYQVATDLSGMKNGFDIEVTQTKVLNIWYPKGSDKSLTARFAKGRNIAQIDFTHDFSKPVNEAIVQGQGFGGAMPEEITDNTNLQGTYGLLQDVIPYKDATDTQQLLDLGAQEILKRGVPQLQLKVYQQPGSDPDWSGLDVGDYVQVDVDHGYLVVHNVLRISIIEVTYNNGVEQVAYTLGAV
jgi:hypothetical protein